MTDQPTPIVSEYTVNALPPEQRVADWWVWNVYVRRARAGYWVVTDGHAFYDADGGHHFLAREAGELSEQQALDLAPRVAVTMRINGMTAVEAAARIMNARNGEAR